MDTKKVLAIQGSYRKDGKTSTMLRAAVEEAKKLGHEVTELNLFEKKIDFCKGCGKCDSTGECVFKNDDIGEITELIKEADVIILAAPVYWGNMPAIVKNLFDRLTGAAMEHTLGFPKPRLTGKRYILLTACNTRSPFDRLAGQSTGIRRTVHEFFKTSGVKKIGVAVSPDTLRRKQVTPKQIDRVRRLVKEI